MFGNYLLTIADQMCLIFSCELWPKAPGKFWNWTGELLEFFHSFSICMSVIFCSLSRYIVVATGDRFR